MHKLNASGAPLKKHAEYEGSQKFMACQKELPESIAWAQANEMEASVLFADSYVGFLKKDKREESLEDAINDPAKFERRFVGIIEEMKSHPHHIKECMAVLLLTTVGDHVDYSDAEYIKKGSHASMDSKIKCVTDGAETQDYRACKAMVDSYSASILGEKGMHTYQEVSFMDKQMDTQLDAMKDPNDPRNALKGQKTLVEEQSKIADQRGVISAAKAGVLLGFMGKMPSIKNLVEDECRPAYERKGAERSLDGLRNKVVEWMEHVHDTAIKKESTKTPPADAYKFAKIKTAIEEFKTAGNSRGSAPLPSQPGAGKMSPGENGGMTQGLKHPCEVGYKSGLKLIANTAAADQAKAIAAEAGVDAATNLAKARILDNQADKIDKAIKGIEDFKPEGGTHVDPDMMATFCQLNPADAKCLDNGLSRGVDFQGNSIVINGGASATTGPGSMKDPENGGFGQNAAGSATPDRSDIADGFYSGLPNAQTASGFVDGNAYRAGVKSDRGQNPGGGGGGGGGASAPGGGRRRRRRRQ